MVSFSTIVKDNPKQHKKKLEYKYFSGTDDLTVVDTPTFSFGEIIISLYTGTRKY